MQNNKRVKLACYTTNVTMAVVGNLSPVLFMTFRSLYGISYSLLGLLVLINFVTQLTIDLIFSFFSYKFNIQKAVKLTPVISVFGLLIYALWPFLLPNHVYVGLVIGTVIFSVSSGFAEVLISPVIAALPSDNPDHEMSKLHSIYAWGVVFVIVVSTLFLLVFGDARWQWLALFFALVPLLAALLFAGAKLPELEKPERASGLKAIFSQKALWLCALAIFLGGAAECTMAQWSSGYIETALGIPKVWGDICGVAVFSVMLGLGRTLYAKYGKSAERVLLLGAIGAAICYLTAAIVPVPIVGLLACAFTGFCVSMLWPGSLIVAAERIPTGGVVMYAMMAAGGDFGASVAPQLVGIITDAVSASDFAGNLASKLSLSVEQIGMKCGILIGFLFSLAAIVVYTILVRTKRNISKQKNENE
ncbi:MAG: MFS transporter [Clostridia bacterium]|nr:MFS transporter [Clostridia bacterium]